MTQKKRRRFDDAFPWEPPQTRRPAQPAPEQRPVQEQLRTSLEAAAPPQPQLSDEEGLDKAYASASGLFLDGAGTLFVAGTRGGLLGGEWRENYATMGVPLVARALGLGAQYRIEDNRRYKQVEQFMRERPGEVKNLVGHSKAAAVLDVWKKNHPEFAGKARLYSTPYEDPLGREGLKDVTDTYKEARKQQRQTQTYQHPEDWLEDAVVGKVSQAIGLDKVQGMRERGTERIANDADFAALLDASATRVQHTNPLGHLFSGGPHDYHEGIAQYRTGFDEDSDRPGGRDPSYGVLPGNPATQQNAPSAPQSSDAGPVRLIE